MQINIDLLPRAKEESKAFIIILSFFILLFLGCSSYEGYLYLDTKHNLRLIEERLAKLTEAKTELGQELSAKNTGISAYNYGHYYQELYTFLATIYVDPMTLYTILREKLPEQAKLESFSFQVDGKILLRGSFLSKGNIALYQHRLVQIPSVKETIVTMIEVAEEQTHFYTDIEVVMHTLAGDHDE